ncbi:MAG TPA: hypothetical protein VMV77_04025 [Bacteroidales bacterium]|nr:hypothetical protein [Bacteroidales bacterium]
MYTSYIGKKFLKLYNDREGTNLSAKEFFGGKFFELFFNDEKHLMHVGNSPFFQKPKEENVKKFGSKALAQYNNLKSSIENDVPNMSIFVGSQAKDVGGTTSGQVTEMDTKTDKDEMYASWMGEALGIGVSGGFVILIDESDVLWALFQGWEYYRKYLNQTPNVKDKQIETWNGQWLWHWVQPWFDPTYPDDNLRIETSEVQGNIAIPTQRWSKIVFALAKKFPNKKITAYAYNLSQMNTTLGFINFYLPEVRKIFELREKLFIDRNNMVLKEEEIETLSTHYNFKDACKLGTIGLRAIEPAKLREYMPKGSILYAQGKEYKFSNEESYTNYQLFKIWIIAMLNKTELLGFASDVAKVLIESECQSKDAKRGKSTTNQESKNLLESKSLKEFIDELTDLMGKSPLNSLQLKKVVEEVIKMPYDLFPLFVTLIRFEYSYQNINK